MIISLYIGHFSRKNFHQKPYLTILLVLYIDNQKIEDDVVVISALTDCAIQIESSRSEFDGAWLPFFSINFLKNRQKLNARAEVNFKGMYSEVFLDFLSGFSDFYPVPPLSKLEYQPKNHEIKVHRSLMGPFDSLEHLLQQKDYPVSLNHPKVKIEHENGKRPNDSDLKSTFKKLRVK